MKTADLRNGAEEQQDTLILDINASCIELETLVDEYRKAILWLSYPNHNQSPSVEKTRQILKRLKEAIIATLSKIEAKTTNITS